MANDKPTKKAITAVVKQALSTVGPEVIEALQHQLPELHVLTAGDCDVVITFHVMRRAGDKPMSALHQAKTTVKAKSWG